MQERPSEEEIAAFRWLWENSPADTTIVATLEEGHLITYYTQRKNLIDDHFMLVNDAEKRFLDLTSLFTTHFQTQVPGNSRKIRAGILHFDAFSKRKI